MIGIRFIHFKQSHKQSYDIGTVGTAAIRADLVVEET